MTAKILKLFCSALIMLSCAAAGFAQDNHPAPPGPRIKQNTAEAINKQVNAIPNIGELMTVIDKATTTREEGKDWSTPVKLVIIFGALAILPSLLVMMTSFTRIIIVLSFVRRALSTQTIPPTIALIGSITIPTIVPMPSLPSFPRNIIPIIKEIPTASTNLSAVFLKFESAMHHHLLFNLPVLVKNFTDI